MRTYIETGHDKPKQNGYNLYPLAEFLAILFLSILILGLFYSNKKAIAILSSSALGLSFILAAVQLFFSSTKITNLSGKDIVCKPKNGTEPFLLPAGKIAYDIDGYAVSESVYKTANSTHVTVYEDGNFETASIVGKALNWYDDAGELKKAPDEGWNLLFKVAGKEKDLA